MYQVEIKMWDEQRKSYIWEPVPQVGSRAPVTFPSLQEAEDFAVTKYARVLKPHMVRVSPMS